jgi:hypothetical protein
MYHLRERADLLARPEMKYAKILFEERNQLGSFHMRPNISPASHACIAILSFGDNIFFAIFRRARSNATNGGENGCHDG